MKKLTSMAMIAALSAAVIGVVEAGAVGDRCTEGPSFTYCGEHVPLKKLPLTFKLNHGGSPSAVSNRDAASATRDAIDTWNDAWPPILLTRSGLSVAFGTCAPLCYGGTTTATPGIADGQNTVGWGDPSSCDGNHAERVAVACLWYEDGAKTKIREVDVILNTSLVWRIAEKDDAVIGELQGSIPVREGFGMSTNWYDLQAVLTHEFGHALGLDDIGDPNRKWPGNFEDLLKHDQTMYRWYVRGSTNKRTLGQGDIMGLLLAARRTADDA